MYSPIAFFAFNRPYHTERTLKSLINNKISKDTEVFAFIDGARNNNELHLIDSVEKIIKSYSGNFKKLTINRSEKNLSTGTTQRINISNVLSKHENIIVLEDDVCVSKYFLEYMNKGLEKYKDFKKVWQINGYNYPIKSNSYQDTFFTRSMQIWGWATWKDRWYEFMDDPLSNDPFYLISKFSKKDIREFNLDLKHDINWSTVIANAEGKLPNTFDICWEAYIFMKKGLCLSPRISLTKNIGHDGSGSICLVDKEFEKAMLNNHRINSFPKKISEDPEALKDIQKYINKKYNFLNRVFNRLSTIYSNLKKTFY